MEDSDSITLCVGGKKVKAKRAVLSENSKYFQALFSGQYADSKIAELDLTKDVNDIKDLKLLLNFMKTKDLEITSQNIDSLLQLSTFFMVEKLIEKCEKFMKDMLNISNCLRYYFLAREQGLTKVIALISLMLKSRMHDLLIFEDDIAQLKDNEIQHLIEKDFFQYCTKDSVCKFLIRWLDNNDILSEKHLDVVGKMTEFFVKIEDGRKYLKEDVGSSKEKALEDILKNRTELDEEMRAKFQNVFQRLTAEESKSNATGEDSESSNSENVEAVFTFSHRKYINRDSEERQTRSNSKSKHAGKYFDICVYNPSTKLWYNIEKCDMDTYYSRINYKGSIRSIIRFYPPHIFCDLHVAGDYILLKDHEFDLKKMVVYNMKSGEWCTMELSVLLADYLEPGARVLDTCFMYWNNCTFIIVKLFSVSPEIPICVHGMLFRGFQICHLPNGKLHLSEIFKTELIPCQLGLLENLTLGTMVGSSSVSNELLILDNTLGDLDLAYVVDLTPLKDRTTAGQLLNAKCIMDLEHDEYETESIFEHLTVEILEKEDRFLVFCDTHGEEVQVKFEYVYHSEKLDVVENGLKVQVLGEETENEFNFRENASRCDFRGSNWMILETDKYNSSFKKVTVQQANGDMVLENHTPPPFMGVISVRAKEVSNDFFSNLQPVKHFLEPPVGKAAGKVKAKSAST